VRGPDLARMAAAVALVASPLACDLVLGLDGLEPARDAGVETSTGSSSGTASSGGSSGSSSGTASSGGSSGSVAEGGTDAGAGMDGTAVTDSAADTATAADSEAADTGSDGSDGGCVPLRVRDKTGSCFVSVGGGTPATNDPQTWCVSPGPVQLAAWPSNTAYELGPTPWHDTAGDHGSGDPGQVDGGVSYAMVTDPGPGRCVWVCCPLTTGTGCPPENPDQCP
jgi:hypothetical protein